MVSRLSTVLFSRKPDERIAVAAKRFYCDKENFGSAGVLFAESGGIYFIEIQSIGDPPCGRHFLKQGSSKVV